MKNTSPSSDGPKNQQASSSSAPKSGDAETGAKDSAAQRADAAAKRGEPLNAANKGERSPKQENL